MRKITLVVLGATLLSFHLAQASDSRSDGHGESWDLNCRFIGKGKQKGKDGVFQCIARAEVCELNDHHGPHRNDHHPCHDRLTVSCNGLPVYSNEVNHQSDGLYEFLVGQNNNPILKYSSDPLNHDQRTHDSRSFMTPSWLSVNGAALDGFCAVEQIFRNCR